MNLLKTIIERLNQRIEVANIFDKQFGLCELNANGNEKAWVHYIGNGQAEVVTNFDAKQGTLFWSKRGKVTVVKTDAFRVSGCKQLYVTSFPLTAYAVVRKSHLPCDSEDAQDWLASRIYKITSGTDPAFKQSIGVINFEVVPSGYINEIKTLTANYEWACVSVDFDVQVITTTEDGCYDICQTGDIPLPDLPACTPCLTEVAVDGVTITGNGTAEDPLSAIGAGGGAIVVQDEGVEVTPVATTLNFTGAGVTASLTSPGVVEVNVPGGGGSGVTSVSGTAPIASSGGATPAISISQASTSSDGYLSSTDWNTFDGKFNVPTGLSTDYLDGLGTPQPFPAIPSVTPSALTKTDDTNVTLALGGSPSTSLLAATSLTLGWSGTLADVRIASAATWNAKQNAITTGTTLQYFRGDLSLDTFPTALPPSGAASGDLSGTYPSPNVSKIHGIDMQSGTPTADDIWIYGGSPAKWQHGKIKTINSTSLIGTGNITTGSVTSVAALTLGTTGTDLSSSVANGTTTPVITLNVPTASAANRGALSAADWSTFNSKGNGTITSVTGTAPIASSGGVTPAISIADAAADGTTKGAATFTASDFNATSGLVSIDYTNGQAASGSAKGFLTSTDWTTFNGKQAAITPAALTKVDDTNVTLTLGGSPTTALLQGASITAGWSGTLADARITSAATWNAKQAALVSGTNIKTINSTSILGSGNYATPFELVVAASDETTALTTGTAKITFRMPRAVTLTAVRASLTTAQASGTIFTVDINEGGVSILSTKLTIDNTETTSTTAATPPVISDTALADDAEITIDIDQIGNGSAKGLKVILIGNYA